MKKLIFKIALLSMLLVFVACANDETSTGGSASLTIPNSTLVAKFFGDMASKDQNPERRPNAGNAGINAGGVTFKFDKQTAEFVNGNAEIIFHNDDNSAAEQSAALKARIIFEASAIIQNPSNKIDGLSNLVGVDIEVATDTTATAIITVNTSGESQFENGEKTKTFNINLTGDYFVAPTIIPNESLITAFQNDKSLNINAAAGMAGIIADEITVNVIDGDFQDDTSANVTFSSGDDNGGKQLAAMKKAVTKAVSDILTLNAVEGLNTTALVNVKINGSGAATATVTIKPKDSFVFQDGRYTKTFKITLSNGTIGFSTISHSTLIAAFKDGTGNDTNTSLNATSGTAGFGGAEINVKYSITDFVSDTGARVSFAKTDFSSSLQVVAMTKSVKQLVEAILKHNDNKVDGLDTNIEVTVKTNATDSATATVTVKALPGFFFEDSANGDNKTFEIALTGKFSMHKEVTNAQLTAAFNGGTDDQSANTDPNTSNAGIAKGMITLKYSSPNFDPDNAVSVTFHADHITFQQQENAIESSVKAIMKLMIENNTVTGLSQTVTVTDIVRKDIKTVTATVNIMTSNGYLFEDNTNSKAFKITLQSEGFAPLSISLDSFEVPATNNIGGKAGVALFIIPDGFAHVTIPVAVTFHAADNTIDAQNKAIKRSMKEMQLLNKEGIVVSSVGDYNTNKTIEVTFSPKPGYKFDGADSKTVRISLKGDFADVVDRYKIVETPFTLSGLSPIRGRAGIPTLRFQSGFREPATVQCMSWHSSDKGNARKGAALRALDKMLTENNSSYPDSDYPFAVEYKKGSVRFKQDADGDMWWDNAAHFQADLTVDDNNYYFPNGTRNRTITFRLLCTII